MFKAKQLATVLANEVSKGKKVGILDLTQGELGTRGSGEIRLKEAAKAAEILGVMVRENLGFRDAFFVNDEIHQHKIIEVIRKYRPSIVLCNAIEDRHIDHGKAAKLTSDACYLSGLPKIETYLNGVKQDAWRPRQVFHYIQWKELTPHFVVDISGFIDKKVESVLAYESQFYNELSNEPSTPISNLNFLESVTYRSKNLGRMVGVDYAEGFTVAIFPAVDSIFDII